MATLQDKWDAIEQETNYVENSLVLIRSDYRGAIFGWLVDVSGLSKRTERF